MKVNDIKTPVSDISGIGPQLTKTLAKINVFTVGDLLQYYPKSHDNQSEKIPLKDFKLHSKVHTVARVMGQEWFGYGKMKNGKALLKV